MHFSHGWLAIGVDVALQSGSLVGRVDFGAPHAVGPSPGAVGSLPSPPRSSPLRRPINIRSSADFGDGRRATAAPAGCTGTCKRHIFVRGPCSGGLYKQWRAATSAQGAVGRAGGGAGPGGDAAVSRADQRRQPARSERVPCVCVTRCRLEARQPAARLNRAAAVRPPALFAHTPAW